MSESVSEEEKSELFGVTINIGQGIGVSGEESGDVGEGMEEVGDGSGDTKVEEALYVADILRLFPYGLSGVRKPDSKLGGGHEKGRETKSFGSIFGKSLLENPFGKLFLGTSL